MAKLLEILKYSDGSLQKAEQLALDAVAHNKPMFWLDLALILSVQGKFTGARQAQAQYLKHFPDCPRVHFGMAPYALMDGELQAGLRLLESGRKISCWGMQHDPQLNARLWRGSESLNQQTALLYCEGGLGDEVLSWRAASWIKERRAKCVIACHASLMSAAARVPDACAVVEISKASAIYCDYWIPAMSAPRLFERKWETLWSGEYVSAHDKLSSNWQAIIPKTDKLRVGIRWRGNPQFEHEQLRAFDPKLLFDATEVDGVARWSLQKETGLELPEGVTDLEPFLGSWENTIAAIANLDLVITSCTSIAHVAAAMGKPTWVVVPILPYYPWARPGPKTDWYPSVTLYRQDKYGDWTVPFEQVKRDLQKLVAEKYHD